MRISKRGTITIPKALRDRYGLAAGVEVEIIPTEDGLLLKRRTADLHPVDRVAGILGVDALGKGVSVDDYIEEIRGR